MKKDFNANEIFIKKLVLRHNRETEKNIAPQKGTLTASFNTDAKLHDVFINL